MQFIIWFTRYVRNCKFHLILILKDPHMEMEMYKAFRYIGYELRFICACKFSIIPVNLQTIIR